VGRRRCATPAAVPHARRAADDAGRAGGIARALWALYLAGAALVGLMGLYDLHDQPGAAQQAAAAAVYAFYQLTGYCLMRGLDKALR
jgi:hypothetical protein